MNVSELLELGANAIRPDAPAGDPARDTAEFEFLQTEIRKLEAADQPTVNWDGVAKAAHAILSVKSKDLLVASYLTLAEFETEGYAGLAAGLVVLRDLVDTHWEGLFPEIKRLRGRAAAFEWLNGRGALAIERGGKRMNGEAIQQALDLVNLIDDKIGPLLDMPPQMGDLRRALEEVANNIPRPAATPAPGEAAGSGATEYAPGAQAVASGPAAITAIESAEELDQALEEVARLGDLCAGWMRANDPPDPFGYRFLRMLYWRQMRESPPNEDGVTVLPDFDPAVLENLEQLQSAGEYAAVLEQTEVLYATAPLWLDLSRHTVLALEGLGKEFVPAGEAVVFELAAMLRRVPELVKLKTSGGIPLADEATKKWIAKKVLAGAPIDMGFAPVEAAGARPRGGEGFAEAQKEARKLARGNKLGPALRILTDGAHRLERLEDRVTWKLEVARLCMTAGRHELALAQFESLDDELRRSSIEDWDPALCAEILRDLLSCRQQVAQSADFAPSELARSRELMGRLCRLDVVSALELNGRE
ncbi:MAG: type VI secretion system protein TssA [Candidatus Eisenbacteria bacterium]